MALISPISGLVGPDEVTPATLTVADEFQYKGGSRQLMLFQNNTGGAVSVTITGADAVSFTCPGTDTVIDASLGFTFAINDGQSYALVPASMSKYMVASDSLIDITSDAPGVELFLIEL